MLVLWSQMWENLRVEFEVKIMLASFARKQTINTHTHTHGCNGQTYLIQQ